MTKHVILFLAANPTGSDALKLAEECAEIHRELRSARHRDDFQFESRWAVSIDEMMRHLTDLDPVVIHFSGHGGQRSGLLLQDERGQPQPVSARALTMMVDSAARNVRVIVLNACYSVAQADVLRTRVDCIVGMAGSISDEGARAFAIRFYGALATRRSIDNAVRQGVAALAAKQLPDEALPRCVTRDGVDASRIVLGPQAMSARVQRAAGLAALVAVIALVGPVWLAHCSRAIRYAGFKITRARFNERADLDTACATEFGPRYRLADYEDVVQHPGDAVGFIRAVGLGVGERNSVHIKFHGARFLQTDRAYFLTRFDGAKPPNYLAHADIESTTLTVGSWHDLMISALCVAE